MTRSLVVGVDGSAQSLRAVDWAADAAALRGAELRLLHVSRPEYADQDASGNSDLPLVRVIADHVVAEAADYARGRHHSLAVTTDVVPGTAAATLLDEVDADSTEALVVGSRGRGGFSGMLLGSVSLRVAAYSTVPIVVVRGRERPEAARRRRVVVGISGSEAEAAIDFAIREAALRGADVLAVHAWRRSRVPSAVAGGLPSAAAPTDEMFAERVLDFALSAALTQQPDAPVKRRQVEGSARTALLRAAAEADLVVLGARRREGHLGPTTHAVLHHAPCPVAIVPVP